MWCFAIRDFTIIKIKVEPLELNIQELNEKLENIKKEYDIAKNDL